MTDIATTPATTEPTTTEPTSITTTTTFGQAISLAPTPGWRTSEFWLKLAAIALTALYASGAVTNNTALAIAGIAATILGALGYTVSRSLVKAAGILLVVGALGSSQVSCAHVRPALAAGAVAMLDCEAAHLDAQVLHDATLLAEGELNHLLAGTPTPSADALSADLAPLKSDLGRCAFASAVALATAALAPSSSSPAVVVSARSSTGPDLRATFTAAARSVGWPAVKVAGGPVL